MYTENRPGFDAKNRFNLPFVMPLDWKTFGDAIKAFYGIQGNGNAKEEAGQIPKLPSDPSKALAQIGSKVQKKAPAKSVSSAPPKTELFPRSEQPAAVPFSDPTVAPALRKLRELLQRDSVNEHELISILRESTPQGAYPPESLERSANTKSGIVT